MAAKGDGRELLAELVAGGLAEPDLDYDQVMAELARGRPTIPVLRPSLKKRAGFHIHFSGPEDRRLLDLVDELVAIARAPYLLPQPPDPPAVDWSRLARDLERTADRHLDLTFTWEQWSEDGYWMVGYSMDDAPGGAFMVRWDGLDAEQMLADLADRLCESHLHETIWGGWPICPNHPTRPMWATVNAAGRAVWRCEADTSDEVTIGDLGA